MGDIEFAPPHIIEPVDRTDELTALMDRRILVLDGAMGTMIQQHKLEEDDFRGVRFVDWPDDLKGNNDLPVSYTHMTLPTKRIV